MLNWMRMEKLSRSKLEVISRGRSRSLIASNNTPTEATPLSLVCFAEAMVPIEIMVHSTRLALTTILPNPNDRIYDVKVLHERRP